MRAERFRHLLAAEGPFASIYFDDSHDTADAEAQLELKWRGLRELLEEQGGPALADVLEPVVLGAKPPVGRSGRGLIASVGGVLVNEHLIRPPAAAVARVSELPYLVPLVEHAAGHDVYLLVAVDHAGGEITVHRNDHDRSESVDGGGYPIHHARRAETPGRGDPQHTVEEAQAKNIRAVSDRLASLVDVTNAEVVFVLGEVQSRSELVADLPERVADRVVELKVGARHSGIDDDVRRAIDEEFLLRRAALIDDAAQRFQAGHGSGLAAEGFASVCAALRDGAVDTLLIGDVGGATVVIGDAVTMIAPDADVLSELGDAPRVVRADEALPMAAVATDASLVRADERLAPADGIAAVLRYARSHN